MYVDQIRRKNIAVLCLMVVSSLMTIRPAYAVDWEHILDVEGGQVFVDLDSYDDDDLYSRIMTKTMYTSPQTSPFKRKSSNDNAAKKSYSSKTVTVQVDCKQHSIGALAVTLLDKQGNVVARETPAGGLAPAVGKTEQGIETLVCQVRKMVRG